MEFLADVICENAFAVLCRVNEVDKDFGEGLGHGRKEVGFYYSALTGRGRLSASLSQGVALGCIILAPSGRRGSPSVPACGEGIRKTETREPRQKASSIISSASIRAAVAASAGQSERVLPASNNSSSSRMTLTRAPAPGLRFSTARGRVSLSRESTFTAAVATRL